MGAARTYSKRLGLAPCIELPQADRSSQTGSILFERMDTANRAQCKQIAMIIEKPSVRGIPA